MESHLLQTKNKDQNYCPIRLGLRLLWRAKTLLGQRQDDPLCVYLDKYFKKCFLTGVDVTRYYRFAVQLVMPNVSSEELKLISTHSSLRVTACVLLAEAGKDGWYIKLRLRWLSDCFEINLRNTKVITSQQHRDALDKANAMLKGLAIIAANLPGTLELSGLVDDLMYVLEDKG